MKLLVTGGSGFIGSAVVRMIVGQTGHEVVNVDALTYAAAPGTLTAVEGSPRYRFERADIRDPAAVERIVRDHRPDAIMHLAAETHVDRSIGTPLAFVETNVTGTAVLLDVAYRYWRDLDEGRRGGFRFHHVSTDEVFGSLGERGAFSETTPYAPNSPYAASKAAADHLVRAWHRTYGLPVVLSNCSNNYGPYQFPEKLIPLMILKAVAGEPLPVYGDGRQRRDWLHVDDHARALLEVLVRGRIGESYNIGGHGERENIEVVHAVCDALDELRPLAGRSRRALISFVPDRPGHDRRYAIDCGKVSGELGWAPQHSFERGLRATVTWYLANEAWWRPLVRERYRGERLGLGYEAGREQGKT